MKRILLLFLLLSLLTTPALADDDAGPFTWNSVTGTFQTVLKGLGWKNIPDQETGTFTANFSGARTATATVSYVRVGKVVTLYVPQNVGASCVSNGFTSGTTDIPASLRPTVSFKFTVTVQNSNTLTNGGECLVSSTGTLSFWAPGDANFTASANCGWYTSPITYIMN